MSQAKNGESMIVGDRNGDFAAFRLMFFTASAEMKAMVANDNKLIKAFATATDAMRRDEIIRLIWSIDHVTPYPSVAIKRSYSSDFTVSVGNGYAYNYDHSETKKAKLNKPDMSKPWTAREMLEGSAECMLSILSYEKMCGTKTTDALINDEAIIKYVSKEATRIAVGKKMLALAEIPRIYDEKVIILTADGRFSSKYVREEAFNAVVKMEIGPERYQMLSASDLKVRRPYLSNQKRSGELMQDWIRTFGVGLILLLPSFITVTHLTRITKVDAENFLIAMQNSEHCDLICEVAQRLSFAKQWAKGETRMKNHIQDYVEAVDYAMDNSNLASNWWFERGGKRDIILKFGTNVLRMSMRRGACRNSMHAAEQARKEEVVGNHEEEDDESSETEEVKMEDDEADADEDEDANAMFFN